MDARMGITDLLLVHPTGEEQGESDEHHGEGRLEGTHHQEALMSTWHQPRILYELQVCD